MYRDFFKKKDMVKKNKSEDKLVEGYHSPQFTGLFCGE